MKMEEFLLNKILENVPVPTFVIDKDHRVRYWNKACEELTGYNKDDIIGTSGHWKPFFSKARPLLADVVLDGVEEFYKKKKIKTRKIRKVKDQEDTYELELFLPHFGRWVYFRASLLRSGGEVIGAVETMEDVSERRLMEEIVKAAEQEKGAVLDSMNEVVMFQNLNHRVLLANRAAGKAVGTDPNALVGDSCYEVWFNRSQPCENCPIEKAYKTGKPQEAEINQGGRVWLVSGHPVKDEGGNIEGIVEVGLDITERKNMEKDLARILENVPVPTFVIDKDHRVRYWNKACEELTGYNKDDIIGTSGHWKPFFSKARPLLADVVLDGVEEFYKKKKIKTRKIRKVKDQEDTYELELFLPGFGRWVYFRASLLRSGGEVIGAVETMEDVSERRLMEEIVKAAEQEKGAVLDSMNEVVVFQDLNHRVLLANRAAGKAVGTDPNALVGDSCYEVWFNRSQPCENCPIEKAYKTGRPQEAELAYGENVWFIRGYPVKDEDGTIEGIVEVGLDITERKYMEKTLERINRILQVSSEINRLIVHEKRRDELLRKACYILGKIKDEAITWVGLFGDDSYEYNEIVTVEVDGEMREKDVINLIPRIPGIKDIKTYGASVLKEGNYWGSSIYESQLMAFPVTIMYEDKIYGILCFLLSENAFSTEERNMIEELADDLGFALWSIEIEQERREAIKQITENLEHFEYLADKLRNPLAIAKGYLEFESEIEPENRLEVISDQIERIHYIVNDLRNKEIDTYELKEKLDQEE